VSAIPLPPPGGRFSDPTLEPIWAAIEILDEAAKHELLDYIQERLAVAGSENRAPRSRTARLVRALREAAKVLVKEDPEAELSVETYRRLRSGNPDYDWPSDGSIRRWVAGSWNDALRRARLPGVSNGDAVIAPKGPRFEPDEMLAAVRQCAEELDRPLPGVEDYLAWARRPDVRNRPGRRPLSPTPFGRCFSSWPDVLRGAGLLEGDALAPKSTRLAPVSGFGYTTDDLHRALRTVADRVGGSPRTAVYQRERGAILSEREASGEPPAPFPSLAPLFDRYECWDDALVDAGLEPLGGRATGCLGPRQIRRTKRVSDEAIFAVLREAYEAIGEPFTTTAYTDWREEEILRDRARRCFRRIPTYPTISQRFGYWATACELAFAEPSEEEDAEPPGGGQQPGTASAEVADV
jgi:hypothetical protein